jgi:4-hydroxybenzoate polyprenyltransferase
VLDVLVVGAWGAAYSWLVGPTTAALVVGAMTAVSHVFQAIGDRGADLRTGVQTSAARSTTTYTMLCLSSAVLCSGFWPSLRFFALLGLAPLILALVLPSSYRAWLLSKLVFGGLFLALLGGLVDTL